MGTTRPTPSWGPAAEHRAALELFQTEVAPALRTEIPSRPLAGPIRPDDRPSTPSSPAERRGR